ncbi:MAG: hypothetical protein RLZZ90_1203 [Actinomycetota bacterium]
MAAMKPRTGDGPMEAEREPRGLIILRVPLEGGGRLVVSVNDEEAKTGFFMSKISSFELWLNHVC